MGLEILLILIIAVVGMIVQSRLQRVFAKYSKVMFHGGLTGREVAEKMLRDHGIPAYPTAEQAVNAMIALYKYGQIKKNKA